MFPERLAKEEDGVWRTEKSVFELIGHEIPSKPGREKFEVKKWLLPMDLTLQHYGFTPDFKSTIFVFMDTLV